jgi:hypothetical protein
MQDNRPDRPDVITLPPLILAATIALGLVLNFFWPASFLPSACCAARYPHHPRRHRPRDFGDPGDVCGEYAPRCPQTLDRFTCAGNACPARGPQADRPVHPRVCGERPSSLGSEVRLPRFIPACAGNACGTMIVVFKGRVL